MPCRRLFFLASLLPLFLLNAHGQETRLISEHPKLLQSFGALPMGFEQNQGQAEDGVRYLGRASGYSVYLSRGEMLLAFDSKNKTQSKPELVRIRLANAKPNVEPQGTDLLPGVTNYYIGNDPAKWHTGVRQFRRVRYHSVYPGVDLIFYGNRHQLEFDLDVAPGVDPSRIRLKVDGARMCKTKAGVQLLTPSGNVALLKRPELYQGAGRSRHSISGGYILRATNEVGFSVGRYDARQALVIDPALIYSTLAELDGGADNPVALAVDSTGAAYLLGQVPTTTVSNFAKIFVAKLNPAGSALVYESYVGSIPHALEPPTSSAQQLAVDANANVYVTGLSNDPNFPTTPGTFSPTHACGGCTDPFAFKLDASGKLVYATFLVQPLPQSLDTAAPFVSSIAVDSTGALYATGTVVTTIVSGLPTQVAGLTTTPGAFQTKRNNGSSAFVFKLHPDGSTIDYASYLGGSTSETPGGIAVDASGVAYVAGGTSSSDFPTTPGAFQTANAGTSAFFSKFKADGSGLLYSTFLGASGIQSFATAVAVDSSPSAYVTGITTGPGFPTTAGAFKTNVSGTDTFNFVSKFDSSGNLSYSTYIGNGVEPGTSGSIIPALSLHVDAAGSAYTSGVTTSAAYPAVGSLFPAPNFPVIFITKVNPAGSALAYSTFYNTTFFGLSSTFVPASMTAVDAQGNFYAAGGTEDTPDPTSPGDFIPGVPLTPGAFQTVPLLPPGKFTGRMFISKIASSLGSPVAVPRPLQVTFSTILTKGTASAPRTIQINNFGDTNLTVTGVTITGANAGDFSSTDSAACVTTISAAGNCSFHVTFTPTTTTGTSNAAVNLSYGGGVAAQAVPLTGQSGFPAFQFGPNPVDFGNSAIPTNGPFQTTSVTFTNSGTGPLHFLAQPTQIGADPLDFCPAGPAGGCGALTAPGPIAPGVTVQILYRFLPQGAGTRTAQLVFQTDAAGSPQTFTLTGNAVPIGNGGFGIGPANGASTSTTISAGQAATYKLVVVSGNGTFNMSCTGAPQGASCNPSPASFTIPPFPAGNGTVVTVTVPTTARSALSVPQPELLILFLVTTTLVGLLFIPRPRLRRVVLGVTALGALATLVSCGGGSGGGGGGGSGTPAGTYTITVTATANGASNSVPLTLTVQ